MSVIPLDKIRTVFEKSTDVTQYPFSLDIIKNLSEIIFPTQVTFFVGENGSGKSTLLKAIAEQAGFGREGGSKNINFKTSEERTYHGTEKLASQLVLSWRYKPTYGYFFRAETFFNVANYIDHIAKEGGGPTSYKSYGGKSIHDQSHGEGFLSFFNHGLGKKGFFVFDEPEAALSPQRQLSLLSIIHEICKDQYSQFIIATHSPILLAYPGATIYSCDNGRIEQIEYTKTDHFQITKQFLLNPDQFLKHLLL